MTEKEEKRLSGKKRKDLFIYGNYKFYYGYRIDRGVKEDPRLLAFKKEWFEGKDCLDIGCNEGLITISIAKKFSCRSILGVDIDGGLIDTAFWNLRKVARNKSSSSIRSMKVEVDVSNEDSKLEQSTSQFSIAQCSSTGENLISRVSFQKQNFVQSLHDSPEKYDTILCLSVTKWIHLNWGDEGLVTLFVKIWRLLRPGGIFLLEPQPWKSYERNKRVSETAKENFSNIKVTPDQFGEILLDKIGFRSVMNVTEGLPNTVAGFERPIFAFRK